MEKNLDQIDQEFDEYYKPKKKSRKSEMSLYASIGILGLILFDAYFHEWKHFIGLLIILIIDLFLWRKFRKDAIKLRADLNNKGNKNYQ